MLHKRFEREIWNNRIILIAIFIGLSSGYLVFFYLSSRVPTRSPSSWIQMSNNLHCELCSPWMLFDINFQNSYSLCDLLEYLESLPLGGIIWSFMIVCQSVTQRTVLQDVANITQLGSSEMCNNFKKAAWSVLKNFEFFWIRWYDLDFFGKNPSHMTEVKSF